MYLSSTRGMIPFLFNCDLNVCTFDDRRTCTGTASPWTSPLSCTKNIHKKPGGPPKKKKNRRRSEFLRFPSPIRLGDPYNPSPWFPSLSPRYPCQYPSSLPSSPSSLLPPPSSLLPPLSVLSPQGLKFFKKRILSYFLKNLLQKRNITPSVIPFSFFFHLVHPAEQSQIFKHPN
jgi:hypothetical protein